MSIPKARNPYLLTGPCADCPFRSDKIFQLGAERAQEIAESLQGGAQFSCHKTTEYLPVADDFDEGREELTTTSRSKFCGGALVVLEREGQPNQSMRIAGRIGIYDPTKLDMNAPVYRSLAEWVQSYREVRTVVDPVYGEVLSFGTCEVCGPNCQNPAGYSGTGANLDPGMCNPLEDVCQACGHMVCPSCRSEEWNEEIKSCIYCANEEEE